MKRFSIFLCLLAMLSSLGGQWVALQGFAWSKMIVQNSQHFTLKQAVTRTLDGKHPCEICHKISQAKSKEDKKPETTLPDFRAPELLQASAPVIGLPKSDFSVAFSVSDLRGFSQTSQRPTSPPPQNTIV